MPGSGLLKRWLVGALLTVLGVVALPGTSRACSICRCGDPTFNALGEDGFAARGFRAAMDWERFDKNEGNPAAETEAQVENRLTLLASYGLSDRLTLFTRVPFSRRALTSSAPGLGSEQMRTSGFSDPEIYAQVRLWASPFAGGLGRRASLSLTGGVKTPWGRNDVQQDGLRVDEHAQPGTGSTDVFGNLAFLYLIDKRSTFFASTAYRHTGENHFGYRYGSSVTANLLYEHKLGSAVDGIVELNFRHAQNDRLDAAGTLGGDTGGSLLYFTPRVLVHVGGGVVARVAAQVPVVRGLNGFQKERAVINAGLTYLFWR
jgi:hypothetical protein